MTFPKIDPDDLVLFGALSGFSTGCAVAVAATTGNSWLALGVGLIVFGLPSALIAFMAAAEEPK